MGMGMGMGMGMQRIVVNIRWIMLISGALTCTMIYVAIAPQAALRATFGASLDGPLAEIVVRNWGSLITLVGAMLIHGAFNPPTRALVLTVAGVSKLTFIGLVLALGTEFLGLQGWVSIAGDLVMVTLFVCYLVATRHTGATR